jgi:4-amino-4-deoxy-L-arabinose transferase-like glycosyltransferase
VIPVFATGSRLIRSMPTQVALLGMVGSLSFFIVAPMYGFNISAVLFTIPVISFLGILVAEAIMRNNLASPGMAWLRRLFEAPCYALAAVVAIAAILHLLVVFQASYYPDEYGVWQVLKLNPWLNIIDFLRRYNELAGGQVVHPPIGLMLMSLGYLMFDSIVGARLISVVFALASIPIVYWLASYFLSRKDAFIASTVFALLPQTIVFMSLALTDTYVFFFGLLSLTSYISAIKQSSKTRLLISGLCLGLAFWSKLGIPLLWSFAIMLSAFFIPWSSWVRRLIWAAVCILIGPAIYSLWSFVSPTSFQISYDMLLLSIVFITKFNIGASPLIISYPELLLQLPIWFSFLVTLFAIVGIYAAVKERNREASWMGLWVIGPLLAMVPYYRDVRYLLICSVPVAILALIGSGYLARKRRHAVLGVVLVFLVIGSVGVVPIVQQQYAGLKESAAILSQLRIPRHEILTNAMVMQLYLPDNELIDVSFYPTEASILSLLATQNVSAVVIIHNERGPWILPPPTTMDLLRAHFAHRIVGGPSSFSWYEILY